MHGTPECHLADHTGETDEDDEDEVGDQEGSAAELADAVRKHPDVGHTHRTPDTGDDKSPFVVEFIFFHSGNFFPVVHE